MCHIGGVRRLTEGNPERVAKELQHIIGIDRQDIIAVSGKTGENVELVLDAIIDRIEDPISFFDKNPKKFRSSVILNEVKDIGYIYPSTGSGWQNNAKFATWNLPADRHGLPLATNITRALIFDSVYDPYKGVVSYIKVLSGKITKEMPVHLIYSENDIKPTEVGHFAPDYVADTDIHAGQIGYMVTGEKSVRDAQIGDTIVAGQIKWTNQKSEIKSQYEYLKSLAIPWFKKAKPYVYAGVYPIDTNDYDKLKDSLDKLSLNDSAIEYTLEESKALGFGFRCGFLGMLHMDIVKERLRREYALDTIFTIPTVVYLVKTRNLTIESIKSGGNIPTLIKSWLYGHILEMVGIKPEEYKDKNEAELIDTYHDIFKPWLVIRSGSDMIEQWLIDEIYEPIADVEVVWPEEFAWNIMELCQEYRGQLLGMDYLDTTRVVRRYTMPMGEILIDFYDRLKSTTKWYATMNYEFTTYKAGELVKLDIFINNERVEALSRIVHADKAAFQGKNVCEKLKELIPKHMFSIPIQAGIGNKMIARETISAMRKDVIAKCYGWDVSRKRKLLQKQKEGKKKMKELGNVNVPSDVFIKMVQRG